MEPMDLVELERNMLLTMRVAAKKGRAFRPSDFNPYVPKRPADRTTCTA